MLPARDVTVVVPAFQAEAWIGETIASIRAQTLPPHAIIVVDNGSTDATPEIAAASGAIVIRENGDGPSRARNAGIRAVTTTWVAFCDADDLWEPTKLARDAAAIDCCPDADVVFSDWTSFDAGGSLRDRTLCNDAAYARVERSTVAPGIARLSRPSLQAAFYRSMFVLTSAATVRREALLAVGLFDERLRIAEDYDIFLRLFARGDAVAIEESLVRYRRHPRGISRDGVVNAAAHADLWRIIEASPERYPTGALAFVKRERFERPRIAGEFAARSGRFEEAAVLLRESLRVRVTAAAVAWYVVSRLFRPRLARLAWETARRAWQRRPGRYAAERTKGLTPSDCGPLTPRHSSRL